MLLFTATPISRGVQDLLSLVGLLGADNFDNDTLEVLEQLDRGARIGDALTDQQRDRLRQEIQRFTVRRTKSALNDLVAQDQNSYRHPESGRICRYPAHEPCVYRTGETPADESAAAEVRDAVNQLAGIIQSICPRHCAWLSSASAASTGCSPHDRITVWWPDDGKAFATREIELLLDRRDASEKLLGSNLPMPTFTSREEDAVVAVEQYIRDLDQPDLAWDGIRDALDPVRRLVDGEDALLSPEVYAEHRQTRQRVMARVAPVAANAPWAFLALSGPQLGAPRWLMLEGDSLQATVGVPPHVAQAPRPQQRVRAHRGR